MKTTYFLLVNTFVYVYVISLCIHVLLCVNEPIDEDHDHTSIGVFLYYRSFFIFTITINP